jgi:nicotinamide-nucleotide amidase
MRAGSTIPDRPIRNAVLLAVGSELTTGETRDTNGGDLARILSQAGVTVEWLSSLPDTLDTVVEALTRALEVADLVVTTGGLGPTPDDLTREAIAAVCGEEPTVDPELAAWLRNLFARRGLPFHETNLKQAWLIPSSRAIPNDRGTAPGWWVDRPDGRVVVALPGPPREMAAMWRDGAMPQLESRGLGRERVTRTFRLTGIGESAVAALIGERLLRAANPVVATYARADAVDVRISAVAEGARSPTELADAAERAVLAKLGDYVWGRDDDTWPAAIGREMTRLGWHTALVEIGTGGTAAQLLGEGAWLRTARLAPSDGSGPLVRIAVQARLEAGTEVGLAVRAVEDGQDTTVELAAIGPFGSSEASQVAFLGGMEGRRRAGVAAAAFLFRIARSVGRENG